MKKKNPVSYSLFDDVSDKEQQPKKKRHYHKRTLEERARDEQRKKQAAAYRMSNEDFLESFKSISKIENLTLSDVAAALVRFFEQKIFYKKCDYILAYPHLCILHRFMIDTANPYNEIPGLFNKFVIEARQKRESRKNGTYQPERKMIDESVIKQNILFTDEDIAEDQKKISEELLIKDEVWYNL